MKILRLLPLLLLTTIATRADGLVTWDFTVYSEGLAVGSPVDTTTGPNGLLSGSGVIETESTPDAYGYYAIESFSGEMNGDSFSASPACSLLQGPDCGVLPIGGGLDGHLIGNFDLTWDGTAYTIVDEDEPPVLGEVLFGPGLPLNSVGGEGQLLNFTLTDPPATTPEPSALALFLLGIAAICLFNRGIRSSQRKNQLPLPSGA